MRDLWDKRPGYLFPIKVTSSDVIKAINDIDTSNYDLFDNYNTIEEKIKHLVQEKYKSKFLQNLGTSRKKIRDDIQKNSKTLDTAILTIQQFLKENMNSSYPITVKIKYENVDVVIKYLSFLEQKINYDTRRLINLMNISQPKPEIISNPIDENYFSYIQTLRWIRDRITYWNNLYIPRYVKGHDVDLYQTEYEKLQKQILEFLFKLKYNFSVFMLKEQNTKFKNHKEVDDNSVRTIAQLNRYIQTCCK